MGQSQGAAVFSVVGAIFLFILVLGLAYLCTRFVGKRYVPRGTGNRVEVLERSPLGPDKALLVVRAAGRVFLLGATAHHIDSIGELDPAQFPEKPGTPGPEGTPFAAALQNALKNWAPGKKQEREEQDE